mgnify:CR=1 FL=1
MSGQVIGVIGGTGNLGAAIAWRLARAGRTVLIGSRKADAAQEKAARLDGLTVQKTLADDDPLLRAARYDLHRRAIEDEQRRRLASLVGLPTIELPRLGRGRPRRTDIERMSELLAERGLFAATAPPA